LSGSNADFQGTLDVTGAATLDSSLSVAGATSLSSLTVSGGTALNGGLTMDTNKFVVADGTGNTTIAGALGVGGACNFNGAVVAMSSVNVATTLIVNGSTTLASTLGVLGTSQFSNSQNFMNGLFVTGSNGLNVGDDVNSPQFQVEKDGSMESKGACAVRSLTVTGSAGLAVSGPATVGSTLGVSGAATFSSTLAAGASTLASANIAGTLGVGGAATFSSTLAAGASTLASANIAGTLGVGGAAAFSSTLGVGGAATFSSTLAAGASSLASLAVAGSSALAGALSVGGASSLNSLAVTGSAGLAVASAADFNGGVTADSIKIDGDTAQRLYIVDSDGSIKDETKLVFDGTDLSIDGGLRVSGDAQIDGDLLVKGAFTYIETENMKVKDSFIYLATGSNGSVDSGLVLSKGAGAAYDLILGQDGGAGEFIFAKVAHNNDGDDPADLNGAELVPAWMSSVELGAAEGSLSGSLEASAAGLLLSSPAGKEIEISAAADLKLAANGNAAISFAAAAQVPDASFSASTVVGMLNELRVDLDNVSVGGNLSKAAYSGSQVAASVLDFAGQQTLASADHKLVDVFLNGVLMAPGFDLTAITTTSVTFDASISFIADDVIVVVARG
jgi:hypothetical protein